jgi:hypothetical protein
MAEFIISRMANWNDISICLRFIIYLRLCLLRIFYIMAPVHL